MSLGCGTLAPSLSAKGLFYTTVALHADGSEPGSPPNTVSVAPQRGRDLARRRLQSSLPPHPRHRRITRSTASLAWSEPHVHRRGEEPTRVWGTYCTLDPKEKTLKLGGVVRTETEPEGWERGNYWDVDSNIRAWNLHEVRRNAARSAHDVHREDQRDRMVLPPRPGDKNEEGRVSISGVMSSDDCFLEAWGFDLGLRDRQGRATSLWKPTGRLEQFRSQRNYDWRDPAVLNERSRRMRRTASAPMECLTLRPEQLDDGSVDAEAQRLDRTGRTYGAVSCHQWDSYDHTAQREAAKLSHSVHGCDARRHDDCPHDQCELRPAAVYTRRFQRFGEDEGLRLHESRAKRVPFS